MAAHRVPLDCSTVKLRCRFRTNRRRPRAQQVNAITAKFRAIAQVFEPVRLTPRVISLSLVPTELLNLGARRNTYRLRINAPKFSDHYHGKHDYSLEFVRQLSAVQFLAQQRSPSATRLSQLPYHDVVRVTSAPNELSKLHAVALESARQAARRHTRAFRIARDRRL